MQFLRHIERTRMLAHLVDVSETSGRDPVHDFEVVMEELRSFSEDLVEKPMIVVATKIDAAQDPERIASLRRLARRRKLPFLKMSSVTGDGPPGARAAHWPKPCWRPRQPGQIPEAAPGESPDELGEA